VRQAYASAQGLREPPSGLTLRVQRGLPRRIWRCEAEGSEGSTQLPCNTGDAFYLQSRVIVPVESLPKSPPMLARLLERIVPVSQPYEDTFPEREYESG
jgi:hypothetical protein